MLRYAKEFLELCTERFPSSRPSQSHAFTLRDGVLVFTLMQGDTFQSFDLSVVDQERAPEELVDELATILASTIVEPVGSPVVEVPPLSIPDETA